MIFKNKNLVFGRYPSCDMLNNALRFLLKNNKEEAFREIVFAISKAGGYIHEDLKEPVKEKMGRQYISKHKNMGEE